MHAIRCLRPEVFHRMISLLSARAGQARSRKYYQLIATWCSEYPYLSIPSKGKSGFGNPHLGNLASHEINSWAQISADPKIMEGLLVRYSKELEDAEYLRHMHHMLFDHPWQKLLPPCSNLVSRYVDMTIDIGYGVPSIPYTNRVEQVEYLENHPAPLVGFEQLLADKFPDIPRGDIRADNKPLLAKIRKWVGGNISSVTNLVLFRRAYRQWKENPSPFSEAVIRHMSTMQPMLYVLDAAAKDLLTPEARRHIIQMPDPFLAKDINLSIEPNELSTYDAVLPLWGVVYDGNHLSKEVIIRLCEDLSAHPEQRQELTQVLCLAGMHQGLDMDGYITRFKISLHDLMNIVH